MYNPLLTQFKHYNVPVDEKDFIDWYTLSNPREVEQVLDELGITMLDDKVQISTIVRNGIHDTNYIRLKLALISKYVSQ